jgi:hypothetical protein
MSIDTRPSEHTQFLLNQSKWDVDKIVDDVIADLGDSVPRATVHQTIVELLANYEDAPVKIFVPILVRQSALEYFRVR